MKKTEILISILTLFFLSFPLPAHCFKNTIKAEMIIKFTEFIEWPEIEKDKDFNIGVIGDECFLNELKKIKPEKIKGKNLNLIEVKNNSPIKKLHILYVHSSMLTSFLDIKKTIEQNHILTISDNEAFIENGGILYFFTKEDGSPGFGINRNAQIKSGLNFSSHLLRLAQIKFYPGGEKND